MTRLERTTTIDTQIASGGQSTYNFGELPQAFVGYSQTEKSTSIYHLLLQFDLRDLPPEAILAAANLRIVVEAQNDCVGRTFELLRLTRDDWTELGATWVGYDGENNWTTPGGDVEPGSVVATVYPEDGADLEFSLVDLVAGAVTERDGWLNLLVRGTATAGIVGMLVHTGDAETPELRPQLTVDFALPCELEVVDHGDGSGATASVATAAAATSSILLCAFNGERTGEAWTDAAAIAGTGSAELALPAGHYFAHAVARHRTIEVVSNVVYFVVRDGADSIHARCLAAVQARLRLLSLDGLHNDRIIIEKVPTTRNLAASVGLPAIVLSPERAAMPSEAGTNGADDVHYDVLVSIVDRDNQEPTLTANLDRYLLWRQQIARAFRNQRLLGVPEVINAEVDPADGPRTEAWKRELLSSSLRLRFICRESRGL